MPNPVMTIKPGVAWSNFHSTSNVGGRVGKLFIPFNAWDDGSAPPAGQPFAPGLAGLKAIVQQAESASMRVRALGSSWSLNNIAFVKDYLVDTTNLAELLVGFSQGSVDPSYRGEIASLVYAQCGNTISKLNNDLANANPPLALPTSGASNGQTIAGAMSTGTHGSAIAVGTALRRETWAAPRTDPSVQSYRTRLLLRVRSSKRSQG